MYCLIKYIRYARRLKNCYKPHNHHETINKEGERL